MTSLGYKLSYTTLISPNQTRPSPFTSLKYRTPSSLSPENPPCSLRLLLCSSSSGRRTAVTGDGGVDAVGLTSLSSFSFLPFFLSLSRSVPLLSQSFSGGFLRFPAKWAAVFGKLRRFFVLQNTLIPNFDFLTFLSRIHFNSLLLTSTCPLVWGWYEVAILCLNL